MPRFRISLIGTMRARAEKVIAAFALLAAALCAAPYLLAQSPTPAAPIIIDTDAGGDDLMAISFLLSRRDVAIEAIIVTNGLAHVPAGARNILRLLALAGRNDIPVYLGRERSLSGAIEFPATWREIADELMGVTLPPAARKPESEPAADYLARRCSDRGHPVRVLALGPLTNLAEALSRVPAAARTPIEMVIMGGALHVPGNLGDGGAYKTNNKSAEWNLFADPLAAERIFALGSGSEDASVIKIRLVPLDATNKVPINSAFLKQFDTAHTPLARVVTQVLDTSRELIQTGAYYAWDPLAAVALVDPAVVRTRCMAVEIRQNPPERGRTVEVTGRPTNACVALDADAKEFERIFFGDLERLGGLDGTPR